MLIYRTIWKESTGLTIPESWCIHHIDGNHSNNDPSNLECISNYVHWCIHFLQGDIVALYGKFIQGASAAGKIGGKVPSVGKGKYIRSPDHLAKLSLNVIKMCKALKEKGRSPEHIARVAAAQRGKLVSIETRTKQSIARMGKIPWNKGMHVKKKN